MELKANLRAALFEDATSKAALLKLSNEGETSGDINIPSKCNEIVSAFGVAVRENRGCASWITEVLKDAGFNVRQASGRWDRSWRPPSVFNNEVDISGHLAAVRLDWS